jgi:hypothetical protein
MGGKRNLKFLPFHFSAKLFKFVADHFDPFLLSGKFLDLTYLVESSRLSNFQRFSFLPRKCSLHVLNVKHLTKMYLGQLRSLIVK